jgi:uncharacterized membrane protein
MSRTESTFWSVLFIVIGTVLLMARTAADGAWPIFAGAVAYAAAAYYVFHLLVRGNEPKR